jgi:hypothetical protein
MADNNNADDLKITLPQYGIEFIRRREGIEVTARGNDVAETAARFIEAIEMTDDIPGYRTGKTKEAGETTRAKIARGMALRKGLAGKH